MNTTKLRIIYSVIAVLGYGAFTLLVVNHGKRIDKLELRQPAKYTQEELSKIAHPGGRGWFDRAPKTNVQCYKSVPDGKISWIRADGTTDTSDLWTWVECPCKTNITHRRRELPFEWIESLWPVIYRASNTVDLITSVIDNQWLEVRQNGSRLLIQGTEFMSHDVSGVVVDIPNEPKVRWAEKLAATVNDLRMVHGGALTQMIINQLPPQN